VTEELFKRRTKRVALNVISLVESLPASRTANVIGRQLLRSGTSIGANYRAACRGKSKADILFKLSIVEEEADETVYWLRERNEQGKNNRKSKIKTSKLEHDSRVDKEASRTV